MIIERALTEEEKALIDARFSYYDNIIKKDLRFLIGYETVVAIIACYCYFQINYEWLWLFVLSVVIFIGIGIWDYVEGTRKNKKIKKRYKEYIHNNSVESVMITVGNYYLFEYGISENEYYLFELADNKILSLINTGFYDYQEGFPGSNFEITVLKNTRNESEILDVSINGDSPKPSKIIKGKAKSAFYNSRFYPNSDTYSIINGNLNDVDKILT